MFVILVYDVRVERVAKVLKKCRQYLYWIQNSVFEGEISEASLRRLKLELQGMIDKEEDSVVIYQFRTTKYSSREILGQVKGGQTQVL
ncbi:MAG: CRISPR-associated endonuclease Cas2 [Bacillota bacterium]|nr:CRISPR-associated endonuclease Cas2 [Bacillota bacterium]